MHNDEIEKLKKERDLRLKLIGERQAQIYTLTSCNKEDYQKVKLLECEITRLKQYGI